MEVGLSARRGLFAPPGLRRRRKDLAFDGDLGDAPDPAWAADIDQVVLRGSWAMTEVVFFHHASGTAIFADLIQNFPRNWFKGWRAPLARYAGIVAPHPGAPRDWRSSFIDRRAARARAGAHSRLADRARADRPRRPGATDGAAFVRSAFAWLRATA